MAEQFADARSVMRRALELARRGEGHVEPNPMVGAVLVDHRLRLIAEGFHQTFGGPHAEVNALHRAGDRAAGATLFVTLEPCCHHGKTPPCTGALIAAAVRKVVIGMQDPAKHVDGGGIAQLKAAGIEVEVGLLEEEVRRLNAPFIKLATTGMPYVHAKWAMTLDGKIASRTGHSRWISSEASRQVVHRLRGRMDAVIVGAGTVRADDPLLTTRPPGPRTATRIVVTGTINLPTDLRLIQTIGEAPLLIAAADSADPVALERLHQAGAEILLLPQTSAADPGSRDATTGTESSQRRVAGVGATGGWGRSGVFGATPPATKGQPKRQVAGVAAQSSQRLPQQRGDNPSDAPHIDLAALLLELGRRQMTNVLVEGGSELLGGCFDQQLIDELHVFIAPKLVGGRSALSPIGGMGLDRIPDWPQLDPAMIETLDGDVYIHGRLQPAGERRA